MKTATAQIHLRPLFDPLHLQETAKRTILPGNISKMRLPLSWARGPFIEPQTVLQKLPLSRSQWICWADIPETWQFSDFLEQTGTKELEPLLVRGCPPEITALLNERGWYRFPAGVEALLSLDHPHFDRASLRELVRRGNRHGNTEEILVTPGAQAKFSRLQHCSAHAHKPQLRYLFRSELEPHNRCFVFQDHLGEWLAALTLSRVSQEFWHTERMLRRPEAPAGVMEALFASVFRQLQAERSRYWSLGEVPFMGAPGRFSLVNRAFIGAGRAFNFAYNYQGLFAFKNKFNPLWQPLYLCSTQRISWAVLWDLFEISGYKRLVQQRLSRLSYQPFLREIPEYENKECI